jgi:hypothetical protein
VVLGLVSAPRSLRIDFWNARLLDISTKTVDIDTNEGAYYPLAVNSITVYHQLSDLPRINCPCPWTEQEQVKKMIVRWAANNPDGDLTHITRTTDLSEQLLANLRVTLDQIRWAAKQTPSRALQSLRATADMMAREMKIG